MDQHSPLITGSKIANSPFLQSVPNQAESQHLMPETGSMLFPCTAKEDTGQSRPDRAPLNQHAVGDAALHARG